LAIDLEGVIGREAAGAGSPQPPLGG
jgi:hypothetical protein